MTHRRRVLIAAAVALAGAVAPASSSSAGTSPVPRPVTRAVRLERRPDLLAAFGADVAGLRARAAASLTLTATERFGRAVTFRAADVELWAVPVRTSARRDETSHSLAVIAVPARSQVHADGTVSPPARPVAAYRVAGVEQAAVDPTFSSNWGTEEYFNWTFFDLDDGGLLCPTTIGEVRGQWEYSRLANVAPGTRYDYWGVAQRAVAEITREAKHCDDTIDWFKVAAQSRTSGAYPARQDPLSGSTGKCEGVNLTIGGSYGGVSASMQQRLEHCETWAVTGALTPSARNFYGVDYDNHGVWNTGQRHAGALEIVRVPRGLPLSINTRLDLDVDNR